MHTFFVLDNYSELCALVVSRMHSQIKICVELLLLLIIKNWFELLLYRFLNSESLWYNHIPSRMSVKVIQKL